MSLKIENVDVHGWEAAIRGARNPMNSWGKSDTVTGCDVNNCPSCSYSPEWCGNTPVILIGPNDHRLLENLCKGGSEESKWRRFVTVSMDLTAPLYWWKEFDTYKVGTACNSCSTMHKIHAKEFTIEDFSCEHLSWGPEHDGTETTLFTKDGDDYDSEVVFPMAVMKDIIDVLNHNRQKFIETKDKKYWWQMIQLLPTSYNQRRTISLNYEVLAKQYRERKNHKLDEWHTYCDWIKTLPYSELITMEEKE